MPDNSNPGDVYSHPNQANLSSSEAITLQAIMDMKEQIGALKQSVDANADTTQNISSKLDETSSKLDKVSTKVNVAAWVIAGLVAIGVFIVNQSWANIAQVLAEILVGGQ